MANLLFNTVVTQLLLYLCYIDLEKGGYPIKKLAILLIFIIPFMTFLMLKHEPDTFTIYGTITEVKDTSLTIQTATQNAYDIQIASHTSTNFKVHDTVEILAEGRVLETYPARIEHVLSIKIYNKKSSTPKSTGFF